MSLPNCWYQMSLLSCDFYLITKMSLPNCRYQIGTFVNLPNCHYQIVVTKLSLPNCRCQIVVAKLSLPNCHVTKLAPYQIVITILSLPNCHYQSDNTKNPPIHRPLQLYTYYYSQSMAWSISIQDFMRKVNYNSNFTESPCPTSFPFLTFQSNIFLLEILSCDNPDFYFFFLAGVLE